jgi:hypothetical protein
MTTFQTGLYFSLVWAHTSSKDVIEPPTGVPWTGCLSSYGRPKHVLASWQVHTASQLLSIITFWHCYILRYPGCFVWLLQVCDLLGFTRKRNRLTFLIVSFHSPLIPATFFLLMCWKFWKDHREFNDCSDRFRLTDWGSLSPVLVSFYRDGTLFFFLQVVSLASFADHLCLSYRFFSFSMFGEDESTYNQRIVCTFITWSHGYFAVTMLIATITTVTLQGPLQTIIIPWAQISFSVC